MHLTSLKIGFLGFGKMGAAIWNGLENQLRFPKEHAFFTEASQELTTQIEQS